MQSCSILLKDYAFLLTKSEHFSSGVAFSCSNKEHYLLELIGLPEGVHNRESESENHSVVSDSLRLQGLYSPWNSPGQNSGVSSLSLLQIPRPGIPGLPHCRLILYQLSHEGSARILWWVAYPFSRGSSRTRKQNRVSCIAGRFFTN